MCTIVVDPPTGQPEFTARKPRAHAFFWTVLAAAAAVSIIGNATQALLHNTALPGVAAAVAIIPPLALLAAVHGVSVLLRAHAGARATHLMATAMTALIATGAFWLSFTALRSLAVTAGVPPSEAWLWPLIIEGSMAQSTVALLALAHSSTHRDDGASPATRSTTERPRTTPVAPPTPVQSQAIPDGSCVHTPSPPADRADREFKDLAALLCARDPGRRRDPDVVAQALAYHHAEGWTPTRIARELNKSRSTISRILSDAAAISDSNAHLDGPTAHQDTDTGGTAPQSTPATDTSAPAVQQLHGTER
ncbi:DUF2637 domain-containing protein [Nocardia abscessus]|uniref:DUF2637 domain-containing protein n=1 Tax=Nocardia abscessus TaxID=120957 RepID=UPI0002FC6CBC|nr:DUF2637 domain-containing protein [Nocardia abscessus]MCC3332023.1 DUF2637 domain-containing protein [Nocardia abscessus]